MKVDLNEIFSKVSLETGIPKSKIELAFKSVFEEVANTMREENGNNILLPKFGKFVVPLRKLRYVNIEKYNEQFSRYYGRLEKFSGKKPQGRGDSIKEAGDLPDM